MKQYRFKHPVSTGGKNYDRGDVIGEGELSEATLNSLLTHKGVEGYFAIEPIETEAAAA